MPLLNYTTTVSVDRSVEKVRSLLVGAGARQVMTEYDSEGIPCALSFSIDTSTGKRAFSLPVDGEKVQAVLRKDNVQPRFQTPGHAWMVAWRIMKDWIEAQLAIIDSEMVSLDEVMLPYMRSSGGSTFYEVYIKGGGTQPALPSGD